MTETTSKKSFLHSPKAKAEALKALKTGTTSAKSAKIPPGKSETVAKELSKAEQKNALWERPNLNAMCRRLAGGDMMAGLFLFHILYVWRNRMIKLDRHGKKWLAHSRETWANASGLTKSEFNKTALPRLRKHCSEFLVIKAMGNGPAKRLWVHVDEGALNMIKGSNNTIPWELFYKALEGIGPGNEKVPTNAYKKDK